MPFQLTLPYILLLPLLGAAVATLGTIVGLGGGFILIPILIFLFPEASPAALITISLTVVFLNAASATIVNIRAHRIDLRTALLLIVGAVPASIAGATTSSLVSRDQFETLFGVLLIIGAAYILWRGTKTSPQDVDVRHDPNREIHERRGPIYRFYVNTLLAGVISPMAGFISSFFGIGGGVIHVPALTFILKVPLRVASATSLLVLVVTSLSAILTLFLSDAIHEGWRRAGFLGIGALFGAQLGVYFSSRVNPKLVLLLLSAAMAMVGIRQIVAGFG
ncbi:MAG: sulfite exporter TauE/SafE family protein [Dehalococcoidia bacterium]|nr:sulfite exporter TauE/SafE family protein [Dehalococcoidia bacterium]